MEDPNPLKVFQNDQSPVVNINDGKLPPQAIDLEEAVIGAMLIDEKGVDEVIEILIPEVFYKKSHQLIFESIERLFKNSEPIDLLTVSADLKKSKTLNNIGGEFYLIELSQKVSSSAHIEFHARIIQQKFIQRKLIKISNEAIIIRSLGCQPEVILSSLSNPLLTPLKPSCLAISSIFLLASLTKSSALTEDFFR